MDRPSCRLVYPTKEPNNMWAYDLMAHLMLETKTIIALASMTYFVDLDVCKLHAWNENQRLY
jgi:hypothetical protein